MKRAQCCKHTVFFFLQVCSCCHIAHEAHLISNINLSSGYQSWCSPRSPSLVIHFRLRTVHLFYIYPAPTSTPKAEVLPKEQACSNKPSDAKLLHPTGMGPNVSTRSVSILITSVDLSSLTPPPIPLNSESVFDTLASNLVFPLLICPIFST